MKDRTLCTSRSSVVGGVCVEKYLSTDNVGESRLTRF